MRESNEEASLMVSVFPVSKDRNTHLIVNKSDENWPEHEESNRRMNN